MHVCKAFGTRKWHLSFAHERRERREGGREGERGEREIGKERGR